MILPLLSIFKVKGTYQLNNKIFKFHNMPVSFKVNLHNQSIEQYYNK